jgi:hypothetical protein
VVASGENERLVATFLERPRNFLERMFRRNTMERERGRIKNPEFVHVQGTGVRRRRFDQGKPGSSIRTGLFIAVQLNQWRCNRAGSQLDASSCTLWCVEA